MLLIAETNKGLKKNIKDLIRENFDSPSSQFRMRCDVCQDETIDETQKQYAQETKIISHLSNILIIQVSKFDNYLKKIRRNICPEDCFEITSGETYELVSIINHIGTNHNSGHYVTFVKRENSWLECNDKTITARIKENIISDNNYLYLYQKTSKAKKHT